MKRRRILIYVVLVLMLVGSGVFAFLNRTSGYASQIDRNPVTAQLDSPQILSVPSVPVVNQQAAPTISTKNSIPPAGLNRARIVTPKIPANRLASFQQPANGIGNSGFAPVNQATNQLLGNSPTRIPQTSSAPRQAASSPFRNLTNNQGFQASNRSLGSVVKPIVQHPVAQQSIRPANSGRSPFGPSAGAANRAVRSRSTTSSPQVSPTILDHAVKGVPNSAGKVQALIRATYIVPEEHVKALVQLFEIADAEVEATVDKNDLTITAGPEAHAAISRFVTTFMQDKEFVPYVSPEENRETSVRVSGNRMRVVRQTSYEESFEPESFGFSNSASNVKILLRANYVLDEEQADALDGLLTCESKLIVETKCSIVTKEVETVEAEADEEAVATDSDAEAKQASESNDSDMIAVDAEGKRVQSDLPTDASPGELEGKPTSKEVCVTTTKLGQIAVAQLVNAMFEAESKDEKASASKQQSKLPASQYYGDKQN